MAKKFKVGDSVTWNSEAGHASGKIIKVHTKDVDYKEYGFTLNRRCLGCTDRGVRKTFTSKER